MDDESITTLKDIPPNIRILSIINCIKLIKFDYPFELKVLDLSKLDEFDIEYVPSSLISMSIITVKTVKHLPWLAAYPIFVRTNKTNLKNLLPQLNKIQCKNGASLKEQRIAMMQFQDILIESGKFKPEEYKF